MTVSFDLSPDLQAFDRALREWALDAIRPRAREADTTHALPVDWQEVLDTAPVPLKRVDKPGTGLPGFPDADGVRNAVFYEAAAWADPWFSESLNDGIGHRVVQAMGTSAQVERWYVPIVRNGGKTGFGLTEPSGGSDTSRLLTTATRDGDTWVINGSKMYCSLGAVADYVIVFATIDKSRGPSAIKAFVVERGTSGMVVLKANEEKLGLRCWTTSQLAFDDCHVPADHLLGWSGDDTEVGAIRGLPAALSNLNDNRPNVSAMSLGLAQAALDVARERLVSDQAGFAPARWSIVESELEVMSETLERARRLNYRAQWLAGEGRRNVLESSIAKAFGPPAAERIIRRCMQLLGAEGVSEDLLLEKWYRDVKILDIFEGTGQVMRLLISRELMGRDKAG